MRRLVALLVGVLGCSDDGPPADPYRCMAAGGEGCFELPTDVVEAATPEGVAAAPILDCSPYQIAQSNGPIAFSGVTTDLQDTELIIPGVRVEAFSDLAMTQVLFDKTSDDSGAYSASAVVPSEGFARSTAAGQLPLLFLYGRIDVNLASQTLNVQTATRLQVASLIEAVGDRFLPDKTQLASVAYDCLGNKLVNVIANLAPASGKNGSRLFEPGVRVYYGMEGPLPILARRTELFQTTTKGTLAITNIAPGRHFVQLWGFPTAGDLAKGSVGLKLLDEKEILVPDGDNGILMPLYGRH